MKAAEMPLTEIRRVVAVFIEDVRYGGHTGRQWIFVTRNALVRIAAGEHGSAEGTAKRKSGKVLGEIDAVHFRPRERGSSRVRIAVHAKRLGSQLITQNPDHVRLGWQSRFRNVVARRRTCVRRPAQI